MANRTMPNLIIASPLYIQTPKLPFNLDIKDFIFEKMNQPPYVNAQIQNTSLPPKNLIYSLI